MMISGAQAKAGRESLGWSLLTMSSKCGLGATAIGRFETGERRLSSFKVMAIRIALEAGGVEFDADGGTRQWHGRVPWAERRTWLMRMAMQLIGGLLFVAAANFTARHFAHQSEKHHYAVIIAVCVGVMAVGLLRAWATDEGHTFWTRQVRKRDGGAS
jgi:transcriptional regulator with XRE-family HTH domain